MWRVSRGWDDEDVALLREGYAVLKGSECSMIETDEARLPPPRPAVGQIALDSSAKAGSSLKFLLGHPKARIGQVNQSSGVIGVEVCQYDLSDISGADPDLPELGTDLLIRMN